MDAHITKNGQIVLMHDEEVDRTTDATGLIEELKNFRAVCPEVATSASRNEVRNYVLLGKALFWGFYTPQFQTIQPPFDPEESLGIPIMTERFVRESHMKNIRVEPWTVNDLER